MNNFNSGFSLLYYTHLSRQFENFAACPLRPPPSRRPRPPTPTLPPEATPRPRGHRPRNMKRFSEHTVNGTSNRKKHSDVTRDEGRHREHRQLEGRHVRSPKTRSLRPLMTVFGKSTSMCA
ncbi:hypothetical protein EYF80_055716 [Liparis tanakae]|uniref:Uncharacterized protein n=1 Tax=Liparis tanakae TaxID=230148 RepID=A0A4Z2EZD0_9TELE|nr:hypothetical protein EYF80_055716 [Liparis tanakae]